LEIFLAVLANILQIRRRPTDFRTDQNDEFGPNLLFRCIAEEIPE
jgi:hypothetical protein